MSRRETWSNESAKLHYRIANWGLGIFDINSIGHVTIKAESSELDLYEVREHLKNQGIELPVLIRFPHILQQLLGELYTAFKQAMSRCNYHGDYIAAYPIKVNQQASVIRHFHEQTQWPIAFEVGSKAELLACLGVAQKQNRIIICNGYKDEAYIRLALIGGLLGHEIIIVLESLIEFKHVIKLSAELNVQPVLGMRVRLSSIAEGNWQNTGGKHSKFGMTANEVLQLVKELQDTNVTKWMRMLHFHMGSQIPTLQHIRNGMQEGMRYFSELTKLGLELTKLNIGGGLAVDYEGSCSNSYFSMDYSISDYANTIIHVVNAICQEKEIMPPTIFSENGRVMTAYHAVLFTNVIDAEYQHGDNYSDNKVFSGHQHFANQNLKLLAQLEQQLTSDIQDASNHIDFSKSYAKLIKLMQGIEKNFTKGEISLVDKACAEKANNVICKKLLSAEKKLAKEYKSELEEKFIDKYFCNFSIFQSTPDIWGLNQIFPVLPLHRLNEMPKHKVRIHDLTCDSDGQIDRYVEAGGIESHLSLHEFCSEHDYVLGLFLVGAYQEILGDMHNLFGDIYAVNIELKSDGGYQICEEEPGDTIEEVLSYVHINTVTMRQIWQEKLTQMKISEKMKKFVLLELEASLKANSYLN